MEANTNTIDQQIAAALRGEDSSAVLYAHGGGYCYRVGDQSGELLPDGWAGLDGATPDATGYTVEAYFSGPDGAYVGPDADGVYPSMVAE